MKRLFPIASTILSVTCAAATLLYGQSAPPPSRPAAPSPTATPRSAADFFKRGVVAYQHGELDDALREFDRAIELATRLAPAAPDTVAPSNIGVLTPAEAPLFYNRGVVHYDRAEWDAARLDFAAALQRNPAYVSARIKLGNLCLKREEWDAAISHFNQALKHDARAVLAWNNRGLARQQQGDVEGALADYSQALKLEPRLPVAFNNRAGIKHDRGDLRGALADYDQAIALDATLAFVFNNRGVTRKKLGQLQGALADYNRAIELRPTFGLAYFNRSAVYKALGKGFEAEADFNRSLTMSDNPTAQLEPPLEAVKADKP
ncbi:MAG: tetratricopeptide repeat protein [Acidobacteria bacterium]|nr:tetratricopeptide repeat protein [Acidobacteriota bacterium]